MSTANVVLTEQDIRKFQEDGYWISPVLIDQDRIGRLRRACERIWAGDYDGEGYPTYGPLPAPANSQKIRKLDFGFWVNDEVRAMVTDPIIGELAAAFMETDEVRLWLDQVISKPGLGERGADVSTAGNVGWHQDYGYWQCSSTANMLTVWIALQDTNPDNGGMMTIVGSHRWGLIPDSDTFFEQDLDLLRRKYASEGRPWIEEPCILKAGQASFHHALTFHGSGPNITNEPRMSVVAHLMPKGTAYRPGVQYHANIRLLGPRPYAGQRFDHDDYFPMVYSTNLNAGSGLR